ncbi:MAG: glutamine-hydrolyzing carbamoyl-phosphate synthase small subunit [Eubacteriales bacterium]|nr:glutamine-hydrolyzing carbamoyl-phosphate synthase small subunit [Eubacteriales bacterium]MDD3349577.1 glutamine-hydrolyzing carbamoyl-phosphate synthase small subunit [Eubacteriales bacterium]
MDGLLVFEDGTVIKGKGFGKKATNVGELVFNTSVVGYQEILTDPSYAGQIINLAYPLIGNYGISIEGRESDRIHAFGLVARNISATPSHYTSIGRLDDWMEQMGTPGVSGVDTRAITRKIRNFGTMKCLISTESISANEAIDLVAKTILQQDQMKTIGVKEIKHIEGKGPRVAVLDFGVKDSILKSLVAKGYDLWIFPYAATAEEILAKNPEGLLLANGPGNPEAATEAVKEVQKLIQKKLPIFGICMGHQILALAVGGKTYKLKYGHRGGNHGVYDNDTGLSSITSQNHGFAVDPQSVIENNMDITHVNLNDGTVEGMRHKSLPLFSVQFHPEASPGPQDSAYLFTRFADLMKGGAK